MRAGGLPIIVDLSIPDSGHSKAVTWKEFNSAVLEVKPREREIALKFGLWCPAEVEPEKGEHAAPKEKKKKEVVEPTDRETIAVFKNYVSLTYEVSLRISFNNNLFRLMSQEMTFRHHPWFLDSNRPLWNLRKII